MENKYEIINKMELKTQIIENLKIGDTVYKEEITFDPFSETYHSLIVIEIDKKLGYKWRKGFNN